MHTRIAMLLSFLLILVCTATMAISSYPAALARPATGLGFSRKIPAGETYKSPKHIFTIVAPRPSPGTFDFSGWDVLYESKTGNHEMVTFSDYDFGETYRAGIVEIGRTTVDLDAVSHVVAVSRKHQIGAPFDFVEEEKVSTKFGEGSLRVYSMKGGSLILEGRGGAKPQVHDSFVAVLLVPQESRTLFAVSQDDDVGIIGKSAEDAWKKSLKDQVQAFFATMLPGE